MKRVFANHVLSALGIALYVIFLIGSAAPQRNLNAGINIVGKYDYTPPSVAKPKSTDIAFALISPNYAPDFRYTNIQPFSDFRKNMGADFEELLIARGYTLRGPFIARDDMVYSDKEQSDFTLAVRLDVEMSQVTDRPWVRAFDLSGRHPMRYQGTLVLSGKVNLAVAEATTGEKLWAKSISLPQRSVDVASQQNYLDTSGLPVQDPGIRNPLTTAMEEYYKTVMNTAWGHLEPLEMKTLVPQAKKIKKEARFSKTRE